LAQLTGLQGQPSERCPTWDYAKERDQTAPHNSTVYSPGERAEGGFLDEMTTGLGPASRRVAWELIDRVREQGATVVMVTHFMDEAERLCDRVAVIHQHTFVATESPAALVAEQRGGGEVTFTTDVAVSFLGAVDGVRQVTREGRRVSVTGTGPLLAHGAVALVARGIAPVDLQVRRASLEDVLLDRSSTAGWVRCRITCRRISAWSSRRCA